eukprot:796257-Karenia_brevis.AAC.1
MNPVTRRYKMPFRGFPAEYSGSRGATLAVKVTRKDSIVPTDASQKLPAFSEGDVTLLLHVALPVPHIISGIVSLTGLHVHERENDAGTFTVWCG